MDVFFEAKLTVRIPYFLMLLAMFHVEADEFECIKSDECSCRINNEAAAQQEISLWTMPGDNAVQGASSRWSYDINLCHGVTKNMNASEGGCRNATVCQYSNSNKKETFEIGRFGNVTFGEYDNTTKSITLLYYGTLQENAVRSIIINLTCEETGNVNKADYYVVTSSPIDPSKFKTTIRSKAACLRPLVGTSTTPSTSASTSPSTPANTTPSTTTRITTPNTTPRTTTPNTTPRTTTQSTTPRTTTQSTTPRTTTPSTTPRITTPSTTPRTTTPSTTPRTTTPNTTPRTTTPNTTPRTTTPNTTPRTTTPNTTPRTTTPNTTPRTTTQSTTPKTTPNTTSPNTRSTTPRATLRTVASGVTSGGKLKTVHIVFIIIGLVLVLAIGSYVAYKIFRKRRRGFYRFLGEEGHIQNAFLTRSGPV